MPCVWSKLKKKNDPFNSLGWGVAQSVKIAFSRIFEKKVYDVITLPKIIIFEKNSF